MLAFKLHSAQYRFSVSIERKWGGFLTRERERAAKAEPKKWLTRTVPKLDLSGLIFVILFFVRIQGGMLKAF